MWPLVQCSVSVVCQVRSGLVTVTAVCLRILLESRGESNCRADGLDLGGNAITIIILTYILKITINFTTESSNVFLIIKLHNTQQLCAIISAVY